MDVALFDQALQAPAQAPSRYDEPTVRSHAKYGGGTSRQRRLRDLLGRTMAQEDFTVHPLEWWHFDHASAPNYAVEDVPFGALQAAAQVR